MKELYSCDEDLLHPAQTILLSEFGSFEQKLDESIEKTVTHFNHLLSRMMNHELKRTYIEHKVTFLNELKSEWKHILFTIKAHEHFKSYSLAKLMEFSNLMRRKF